jgi:RNA polymerase sigma factor (sigma-70 family)
MHPAAHEAAVTTFERERRRLFGVAYRMLGSIGEAEDIVQDAYLRWARLSDRDRVGIEKPGPYLIRVVTRLCIDARRSAHARRMTYVGPWLPEPLVGSAADGLTGDPSGLQERSDDLSVAFLVMLERLSPAQRAVLVLKESFDYSYKDIATVVQKSEQNCRQIHRRALARLKEEGRVPGPFDREGHERLLHRFLEATRHGDVDAFVAILAEDVVSYADGGGKAFTARRPVSGVAHVARYLAGLVGLARRRLADIDVEFRIGRVNGEAAVLTYWDGRLHNVIALSVAGERIRRIYFIVNPDKLPLDA